MLRTHRRLDDQLVQAQLMGAPNWVLRTISWLRAPVVRLVSHLTDRVKELEEGRYEGPGKPNDVGPSPTRRDS